MFVSDVCLQPKVVDITRAPASCQSTRSLLRCSTAGRIGKAKIRTLKMTLVIGMSNHYTIGVGRLRILGGGQGLEYWGGGGARGAKLPVLTSMRRNYVASTSFRRHVPTRFLINQC